MSHREREATQPATGGWRFLEDFSLRRAGFPFDLLAGLACPTTYRLLHQGSTEEARAAFLEESSAATDHLLQLGREERVQQAIYMNSPTFYRHGLLPLLNEEQTGKRRRSAQTTLTGYLQRFCAKNDTASYFGPLNYGRLSREPGVPALRYRLAPEALRSHVHLSHWVVAELYRAMAEDEELRLALPLERSALVVENGAGVTILGLPGLRLNASSARVLRACCRGRSGFDVARRLGLEPAALDAIVRQLTATGLLRLRAEPPADRLEVLSAFRETVAAAPPGAARAGWLGFVDRISDLLRGFEVGKLAARISLTEELERLCAQRLGLNPRRGAGGLYMDRFVLFEQCVGDVEGLAIGERLAGALSGIGTALDLIAWNAREVARAYQRPAWALVEAAGLAGRTMPLLELLERLPQHEPPGAPDRTAWRRFWARILERLAPGPVLELSRSQIEATGLVDLSVGGWITAPDLMLAATGSDAVERGDFRIVLAEVHPIILAAQLHSAAYRSDLESVALRARRALESTFVDAEEAILASTRVSKITEAGLQRVRIHQEWLGQSADAEDVPIADLDAELIEAHGCALRIRGTDRRLHLRRPFFMDHPMPAVLGLFERPQVLAMEIDVADHLPRIVVDGIVIQRERWRFGLEDLPDSKGDRESFEFYASMVAWQRRHGLPQRVFGRMQGRGEVKPFLIDFASPLSCRALVRECRGATGMVITEMYPGPSDLWLRGPAGGFTSELRLNAYYPAGDDALEAIPEGLVARLEHLRQRMAALHVED